MKKICAIVLSAVLLMASVPTCVVSAASAADLQYEIVDGEVTITGCNPSADGELIIPDTIEGYPVTAIGVEAFYGCNQLDSVVIPDGVIIIEEYAFYECGDLDSVTIPNSITAIGQYAFYNCRLLMDVNIPSGITTIGPYAFYYCRSLTTLTIPERVTVIGDCTFYGCSELTELTIPEGVTAIGDYAFYFCRKLTSVVIPNSVMTIGEYAFKWCNDLTSVTIGTGVTSIGKGAFDIEGVIRRADIFDMVAWMNIDFEEPTSNPLTQGADLYLNGELVTEITVPSSVTEIKDCTFFSCSDLTTVIIPDHVVSIGNRAFENCYNLASVTIGDGVTHIGDSAFRADRDLASLKIGNRVESIGSQAFYACESLYAISFPLSLTEIKSGAFRYSENLTDVYYAGNEEERERIAVSDYNDVLIGAMWHYNYTIAPIVTAGDVNGDGKINNRDLGVLQQYLNGYDVKPHAVGVDVNANGLVNNRDLGLLQQYLNDWDVTLGPVQPVIPPPDNRPTIKILSIGHSFSKDAMDTYMSALFKAAGYNATFGYLFYPGCSLERQYHYVKENSTSYQQYNKCVDGTWIERGGSNANTALYDEDWDIVTFQPSPDYGKGTIAYKCEWGCNRNIENDYVHFSDLVGIVRQRLHANGNKDVKFYYHLTWAFAADCKLWSFTYSGFNQMTMFWDFWKATLKHVTPLSEIQGVIPCITSVQNARTSWMGDTFNEPGEFNPNKDGYHLNDKGDLVAAMTWVCYFTGKKAADLKIKTPYSDAEYAAIAEAVDNAIAKPQAVTQSSYTTAP